MLILILIDVQYLQNVVFSFEKGSNDQMSPPPSPFTLISGDLLTPLNKGGFTMSTSYCLALSVI